MFRGALRAVDLGRRREEVVVRRIEGSDKAVASLEFSEGVEALAGYGLETFPSHNGECSPGSLVIIRPDCSLSLTLPSSAQEYLASPAASHNLACPCARSHLHRFVHAKHRYWLNDAYIFSTGLCNYTPQNPPFPLAP
jgi:hypothetical protein